MPNTVGSVSGTTWKMSEHVRPPNDKGDWYRSQEADWGPIKVSEGQGGWRERVLGEGVASNVPCRESGLGCPRVDLHPELLSIWHRGDLHVDFSSDGCLGPEGGEASERFRVPFLPDLTDWGSYGPAHADSLPPASCWFPLPSRWSTPERLWRWLLKARQTAGEVSPLPAVGAVLGVGRAVRTFMVPRFSRTHCRTAG